MAAPISIIATSYNRERYIGAAIASILRQTRGDFELLVWDDGSTDRSVDVAIAWGKRDPRVRVIAAEHQGLAPALKGAIAASRGIYVGWVDSDDLLAPTAIEKTAAVLDARREVGLVYTDYLVTDDNLRVLGYGKRCRIPYSKDRLLIDFMTFHFRLFRREAYDRGGGINSEFNRACDYDLCLRLSEVTQVNHIKEPLYYYRRHSENMTNKQVEQIIESQAVINEALERRGLAEEYKIEVEIVGRFFLRPQRESISQPNLSKSSAREPGEVFSSMSETSGTSNVLYPSSENQAFPEDRAARTEEAQEAQEAITRSPHQLPAIAPRIAIKKEASLKLLPPQIDEKTVRISAELNLGENRHDIWYELPLAWQHAATSLADPFVVGLTIYLMQQNIDRLPVEGKVSPGLIANLDKCQQQWQKWNPQYRPFGIEAIEAEAGREEPVSKPTEKPTESKPTGSNRAVLGFSGGISSCFSAVQNRSALAAGVMVHGFDIPLPRKSEFEEARQKAQVQLESLGLPLIPLRTNLRKWNRNWEYGHGVVLASCLILLQKQYKQGIIASSLYRGRGALEKGEVSLATELLPYGSNPITDPLLSSDFFRILHDGTEVGQLRKIEELAKYPEIFDRLRVCERGVKGGAQKGLNCCRCHQCAVALIAFRLLALSRPASFPLPLDLEQLPTAPPSKPSKLIYGQLLEAARGQGCDNSWASRLRELLAG